MWFTCLYIIWHSNLLNLIKIIKKELNLRTKICFLGVIGIAQRLRLKYLPEYTISVVLPHIVYVDPILIVSTINVVQVNNYKMWFIMRIYIVISNIVWKYKIHIHLQSLRNRTEKLGFQAVSKARTNTFYICRQCTYIVYVNAF